MYIMYNTMYIIHKELIRRKEYNIIYVNYKWVHVVKTLSSKLNRDKQGSKLGLLSKELRKNSASARALLG